MENATDSQVPRDMRS